MVAAQIAYDPALGDGGRVTQLGTKDVCGAERKCYLKNLGQLYNSFVSEGEAKNQQGRLSCH